MKTYQERKAAAREEAIQWQIDTFDDFMTMTWAELSEATYHFEKLGRRYGLLREFRENGIC